MNVLKDVVEIPIYTTKELTMEIFFGNSIDDVKVQFPRLAYHTPEEIVKVSDYNAIAKLYGIRQYDVKNNEYIVLCNFKNIEEIRNQILEKGSNPITIAGKQYFSKYEKCQEGFIVMSSSHVNTGIILVPDDCPLTKDNQEQTFMAANYNAESEEEKEKIEAMFDNTKSSFIQNLYNNGITIDGVSKVKITEASVGLATIITFISIYLGVIFLIASSAILALKQLTESSDNRQRYIILRKIGCDEKMINKALFRQIGVFFGLPLVLAIIHSIFGIQFVLSMMVGLASTEDLLPSIVTTVCVMGVIYGAYFLATYLGSKNIIKEE